MIAEPAIPEPLIDSDEGWLLKLPEQHRHSVILDDFSRSQLG